MKCIFTFIFIFISFYSIAEKQTINVGYFTSAPNMICEKDCAKPTGAAIELLEDIYKDSPYKLAWKNLPFLRLVKYLETGVIDVIVLLGKNKERMNKFRYPSTPFHYMKSAIAINKKQNIHSIKNLKKMSNWELIYFKKAIVPKALADIGVKWKYLDRKTYFQVGLQMICYERAKAILYPVKSVLLYKIKNSKYDSCLEVIDLPIKPEPLYTLFSKKVDTSVMKYYEKKLAEILAVKSFDDYLYPYLK
jgi:hypothetical protein